MDDLEGDVEEFKLNVTEFSIIDDKIKDAESKIKPIKKLILELKKEKTELRVDICNYMDTNDIDQCNLPNNGSITFKKKKSVIPINKNTIKEDLNRFFCVGPGHEPGFLGKSDVQKATDVYNYIYQNREYKLTNTLLTKK